MNLQFMKQSKCINLLESRSDRLGFIVRLIFLLIFILICHQAPAETKLLPADLMERSIKAVRFKESIISATFTLINKDGDTRIRKTIAFNRLDSNGSDSMKLIRFISPSDIKGTSTLMIENSSADDALWVYLPAFRKIRRLSADNKRDSFIGSDLSYGDVLGYRTADWSHSIVKESSVSGIPCVVVQSFPVSETIKLNTGYSKRLTCIDKINFLALRMDAWDENGVLLKTIIAKGYKQAGRDSKWYPAVTEVENIQTGHKSVIQVDDFKTDQELDVNLFNPRMLEK